MGTHDGHRKRMKTRFLREGADALHDHELLELLLYYAIPRADTNAMAHVLLQRFGSLQGVLQAPISALCAVQGVGEHAATLLKVGEAITRRMELHAQERISYLHTGAEAAAYIAPRFQNADCEIVYLVCLDGRSRILSCQEVARGVPTQVEISVRRVVEIALQQEAQGVILFHNHLDSNAHPSREDEVGTIRISNALANLGITLVDHIILSDLDYFSMSDSGMLSHRTLFGGAGIC